MVFLTGCLHRATALEVAAASSVAWQTTQKGAPCLGSSASAPPARHRELVCADKPNKCQTLRCVWAGVHLPGVHMCAACVYAEIWAHRGCGVLSALWVAVVGNVLCEHL